MKHQRLSSILSVPHHRPIAGYAGYAARLTSSLPFSQSHLRFEKLVNPIAQKLKVPVLKLSPDLLTSTSEVPCLSCMRQKPGVFAMITVSTRPSAHRISLPRSLILIAAGAPTSCTPGKSMPSLAHSHNQSVLFPFALWGSILGSGTTGRPKGVYTTHENVEAQVFWPQAIPLSC